MLPRRLWLWIGLALLALVLAGVVLQAVNQLLALATAIPAKSKLPATLRVKEVLKRFLDARAPTSGRLSVRAVQPSCLGSRGAPVAPRSPWAPVRHQSCR